MFNTALYNQREAALNAGDADEYNRIDRLLRPRCRCGALAAAGRTVSRGGDFWRACSPCADAVQEAA